jgi:hypothetical protein
MEKVISEKEREFEKVYIRLSGDEGLSPENLYNYIFEIVHKRVWAFEHETDPENYFQKIKF